MRKRWFKVVLILVLLVVLGYVSWTSLLRRTLHSFEFLERGISLQEITSRLGEPDRTRGSGTLYAIYDLIDGRTVELVFLDPHALFDAVVCDKQRTTCERFFED